MIEQALYEHLQEQTVLSAYLAQYDDAPAIFNQEAPADSDERWGREQYNRIVFAVDLQGDPARIFGGMLAVDIMCKDDAPEDIEPIIRKLIHGYFFSSGKFTVSAQWKNSAYFTEPTDLIKGCTVTFDLLAFPKLSTCEPDVIERLNEWTCDNFENVYVINHNQLPDNAWKPRCGEYAVYWRMLTENPARWIPDTFQTIWRTATVKGHIFAKDNDSGQFARLIVRKLYADKRLRKPNEGSIMVNQRNTVEIGADALRTGQITIEATYGIIVHFENEDTIDKINYSLDGKERSIR